LQEISDRQTGAASKTRLVEQIKAMLRAGEYARALNLLRSASAEFADDADLNELEKLAQKGASHKAEADRLITESQELFAQQKSGEAIQLLRKAYELDKSNALARTILANALVEHAQSIVETDWLQAETLANQALALNPAHPTAKTILSLIVHKKEESSVEDWVAQATKLHSSGDLFAALAWVAEGLAVHPHDPKLLQIQDAVQRDQEARRRQARRGDLDELRRLQNEIGGATDNAAKQALVERIQKVAAKHWTDGEILSIANALLLRLGMLPQESSTAPSRRKGATVIFHVPRPNAPEISRADTNQSVPSKVSANPTPSQNIASSAVVPGKAADKVAQDAAPPTKTAANKDAPDQAPPTKVAKRLAAPVVVPQSLTTSTAAAPEPWAKITPRPARAKQAPRSSFKTLVVVSAASVILIAAIFFFARKRQSPAVAQTPSAIPSISTSSATEPATSAPAIAAPAAPPSDEQPSQASQPDIPVPPETVEGKSTLDVSPATPDRKDLGTLVVVVGQDGARVSINGKLQRQLSQGGQLRIARLELNDYVVQVSKNGFQDPPQQKIRIRKGEEAKLVFNLQPQPASPSALVASLTIQGGTPGTAVLIDQTSVGMVQSDGTLTFSSVSPGDHTVELRKERFKSRQFKKHFAAGSAVAIAAAEAALEGAPGELRISFAPADANVAIVKGDLLKIVSSGVPLNLAPGTYTITARTSDRFTRSATVEVTAGQSRSLDLSLAPNGMSKWEDAGAWKHEGDAFTRKGGDFVLYGAVPVSGTFIFSARPTKGHLLQWVFNYTDPKNYILFQLDDNYFYRTVIRNGQKIGDIRVSDKGDKKSLRTLHILVNSTEIVHQMKHGDSWTVVDRWTQPGSNPGQGKFGLYIPGSDQVELSGFAHYADLKIR